MNSLIYNGYSQQDECTKSYRINDIIPQQMIKNYEYENRSISYPCIQEMRSKLEEQRLIPMKDCYINEAGQYVINPKDFYHKSGENKSLNDSPAKSTNEDSKSVQKESVNCNQFKENYIDLLINSINSQMNSGSITMEYINSPTFEASKLGLALSNLSELNEDKENNFSKKCENKTCTYLASNPHKLFYAKFFASNSYKSKSLWLCEKCFKAYSTGNYCYYCNTIYREYEYGTQYYDRKKWIQCDYCQKWHHMQCEEKKGKYENIEELSLNTNFKYMCPICRKEHASYMRQQHKNDKIKKNNILLQKKRSTSSIDSEVTNRFRNKK